MASYKVGDRAEVSSCLALSDSACSDDAQVLMEAVAQGKRLRCGCARLFSRARALDCHEEDIKPEERNINNKGKKKQVRRHG